MLGTTDIVAFVPITDSERARSFYEGVLGCASSRTTDLPWYSRRTES